MLRVLAWHQGDVPTVLGPIPPPPSEDSRADQRWDQTGGEHDHVPVSLLVTPPPCPGAVGAGSVPGEHQPSWWHQQETSLATRGWAGESRS